MVSRGFINNPSGDLFRRQFSGGAFPAYKSGGSAFSLGLYRQDELIKQDECEAFILRFQQIEQEEEHRNPDIEGGKKRPGRKARITLDVFNAEWEKRKAAIEGLESAFEVAKKKRDSKHDTKKAQEAAVKECESAGVELYKAKNNRN